MQLPGAAPAARHVTQFYDLSSHRAACDTQYSFLQAQRKGAMTINRGRRLVMDRTRGADVLPLQRDGLVAAGPGDPTARSKELRLTAAGIAACAPGAGWEEAQARFESAFGVKRAKSFVRSSTRRDGRRTTPSFRDDPEKWCRFSERSAPTQS